MRKITDSSQFNSDQAQVFITFFKYIVTKALISNNGKMKRIQRITNTCFYASGTVCDKKFKKIKTLLPDIPNIYIEESQIQIG